jgi:hypothetical protein
MTFLPLSKVQGLAEGLILKKNSEHLNTFKKSSAEGHVGWLSEMF